MPPRTPKISDEDPMAPPAVQDCGPAARRHPCPDCHHCLLCSESRCTVCRSAANRAPKMSMAEQIALYDSRNRHILGTRKP